jgi:hypothetical protein
MGRYDVLTHLWVYIIPYTNALHKKARQLFTPKSEAMQVIHIAEVTEKNLSK